MLTLEQLNYALGLGWDEEYNAKIIFTFHEQAGGYSEEITITYGKWNKRFKLQKRLETAHLPNSLSFKSSDMKILFRSLIKGYKDYNAILPIEITSKGLKVLHGPGKGTEVPAK